MLTALARPKTAGTAAGPATRTITSSPGRTTTRRSGSSGSPVSPGRRSPPVWGLSCPPLGHAPHLVCSKARQPGTKRQDVLTQPGVHAAKLRGSQESIVGLGIGEKHAAIELVTPKIMDGTDLVHTV